MGWECDERGYICTRWDFEAITGGSVSGGFYHWNGTDWVEAPTTFTGSVTGGAIERGEVSYWGVVTNSGYGYHYDFAGVWTSGWQTVGVAEGQGYTFGDRGGQDGFFWLTTYSPEPATITLVGLGLAGLSIRRKRRV